MSEIDRAWLSLMGMVLLIATAAISCSTSGCLRYQKDADSLRNQAVMRGYAEWKATDHGPEWKWKEKNE